MLHYLGFLALLYIVALVFAPSQVIAATVFAFACAWTLVDWTTVYYLP